MPLTLKQIKRQERRRELRDIEAKLHPNHKVGDVEICHRHQGQHIHFTAWRGNNQINMREVKIDRQDILNTAEDIYNSYKDEIRWLLGEE